MSVSLETREGLPWLALRDKNFLKMLPSRSPVNELPCTKYPSVCTYTHLATLLTELSTGVKWRYLPKSLNLL